MERFYWHFSNRKGPGRPSLFILPPPSLPFIAIFSRAAETGLKPELILSADVLNPLVAAWSPEQKKSSLSSFQWNPLLVNTEPNRLFSDRRFQEWNADEEGGRKCGPYDFHMRVDEGDISSPPPPSFFFPQKEEYNADTDYPRVTFRMAGFCYLTEEKDRHKLKKRE